MVWGEQLVSGSDFCVSRPDVPLMRINSCTRKRSDWPRVTVDPQIGRAWVHASPPRYCLRRREDRTWIVAISVRHCQILPGKSEHCDTRKAGHLYPAFLRTAEMVRLPDYSSASSVSSSSSFSQPS